MSFDPKDKSIWGILNSPFAVSIVAAALLGFVGWIYTAGIVPKVEDNARYHRLIRELEYRTTVAASEEHPAKQISLLDGRDASDYAFLEFSGRPLYSMLIELESLGWYRQPEIRAELKRLTVNLKSDSASDVLRLLESVVIELRPPDDPQYKAVLEEWAKR